MKKLCTLIIGFAIFACSSSDESSNPDDNQNNDSTFNIELSSNSTAIIDEIIVVEITGNENIMTLEVSLDNFQTTFFNQTNSNGFGTSTSLYFSFDELGNKIISIKAINTNGDETIKAKSIIISRGNAVKITSVQIVSFSNINNTWDPEFPSTDINHLADVFFNFQKPKVGITSNSFNFQNWFLSSIKENQGDLIWNVASEDLYLDPNFTLHYSMGDDDGGGVSQDIMLGPPFEREIIFANYIVTQPATITLSDSSINLEVLLTLDWP